jgi:aspartate racemase
MKTIGIVGGIAWPSSIVYYRQINEMVSERLGDGGLHSARLVLAQADFDEIERCQREDRWDRVGEILAAEGEKLRLAGAHFFLLACNTVHIAARQVEGSVDLPFLHIVDATAETALAQGHSTVGLLGSRYTMYGDYFVGRLRERYGLNVIVAEGQHAEAVHDALYAELARGIVLPETGEGKDGWSFPLVNYLPVAPRAREGRVVVWCDPVRWARHGVVAVFRCWAR